MRVETVLDTEIVESFARNGITFRNQRRGWVAINRGRHYGPYHRQLAAMHAAIKAHATPVATLKDQVDLVAQAPNLDESWAHLGDIADASLYARKLGPRAILVEAQLPGLTITTNGTDLNVSATDTADDAAIGRAVRAGLIEQLFALVTLCDWRQA